MSDAMDGPTHPDAPSHPAAGVAPARSLPSGGVTDGVTGGWPSAGDVSPDVEAGVPARPAPAAPAPVGGTNARRTSAAPADRDDLDIEQPGALAAYLRATGRIPPGEEPAVTVLAGGVSNRTVLVERPSGEAWVVKQALAKLRVAVDWFSDPARIAREADGLRWLAVLAPPGTTTPLVFEDRGRHVLAMQAVPRPHANWKTMLLAGDIRPDHVAQFGHLLGTVHRQSAARLADLRPAFADRGFFESLRLEPYYLYTAGRVPQAAPFLHALVADTRATAAALTHGDYSPKNVLVHDDRLVLLDHEVAHLGDPAFDLGFALTHLLSKAHHLPASRPAFHAAALLFWDTYRPTVSMDADAGVGVHGRAPALADPPPAPAPLPLDAPHPTDVSPALRGRLPAVDRPPDGRSPNDRRPDAMSDISPRAAPAPVDSHGRATYGVLPPADLEPRAVRHTLACLLARARGRSPLEYLSDSARDRQAAAVLALLPDPPPTVAALADRFLHEIGAREP